MTDRSPAPSSALLPGLAGAAIDDLAAWLSGLGEPGYRLDQLLEWAWRHAAETADEMRTLPARLRSEVSASYRVSTLAGTSVRTADRRLTEKALHRLGDGSLVESVLMRYPGRPGRRARATVCVSSQVGCAVGCPFCATGELGFARNLEAAEMADQVRFWAHRLAAEGGRVTNVVFMGMGEPLLNLDSLIAAADALTDPRRFGLGARHVALSTVGVVPGIARLTALAPPWTLAISLHAVRSELRDRLVPVNRRYPVAEVVAAASEYTRATGRRVSYEYVLIDGVNDNRLDAADLAQLLRGALAHVNLIPMNPVAHTPWLPSPRHRVLAFAGVLRSGGISTTIRRTRGDEVGAACGQLAARADQELSGRTGDRRQPRPLVQPDGDPTVGR